ncbi:MAG: D-tyrosyl-tRNA(Tyr) deacylase [Phycisphaerae bacterium]|nr:D-tyrosyl-tRNA(Tyr) deacylase [Phycisphaerae bacterium]
MIAVIQRVTSASVSVSEPHYKSNIQHGFCILLGVEDGDDETEANWFAKKISTMRIFPDAEGKMNLSILDVTGEILLISQFTLAANCSQGNRPSFVRAASPELAEPLYERVGEQLEKTGIVVTYGVFGADMKVEISNDGPVTIILKRDYTT